MLKGYRLKSQKLKQPIHKPIEMGFGVFTFYHDPNVEGQFTLAIPNVPKCTFIQVKRSSKAHFIRGNKSAQVGCWQIGKILCQKVDYVLHGRVKLLLSIMLWNVPVKPVMLGHARRCTQHNGQGEDHSTALMYGVADSRIKKKKIIMFNRHMLVTITSVCLLIAKRLCDVMWSRR
jgi:hypothetical protein